METGSIITANLPHGTGLCFFLESVLPFPSYTSPISGSSVDFAIVVKLLLCFALLFTYPVMLFPVVQLVEANVESGLLTLLWRIGLVADIQVRF